METIRALVVVHALAMLLGCSSQDASLPPTQSAFNQQVDSLQERYSASRSSANEFQTRDAEASAVAFLRESAHRADQWIARVTEVRSSGDDAVAVLEQDSATFHLHLFEPDGKTWAGGLQKGARVRFSGDMGPERSLTLRGGISEPEFHFAPEAVALIEGQQAIVQGKDAIAARVLAERQALADAKAQTDVAVACQAAALTKLVLPESADFSWLQQATQKQPDGTWLYSNTVTAKNRFGAEIPHRFICRSKIMENAKPQILALEFIH